MNSLRTGKQREQTVSKLIRGASRDFDDTASNTTSKQNNPPTKLYPTNAQVDKENRFHLDALGAVETMEYDARDTTKGKYKINNKSCPVPPHLTLKLGASVMLLRNLDTSKGLVNGCLGEVVGFMESSSLPIVRFAPSNNRVTRVQRQRITVNESTWERKSGGEVVATRTALPLRLSYALTIHKSQGQTLPRVLIDFKSRAFAAGMAYSALSRATGFRGLAVKKLSVSDIRVSDKVIQWYQNLFGAVC